MPDQQPPAFTLSPVVFTEKDGVYSWTADLTLGGHPIARVAYSGAKKLAVAEPVAPTSGAATELARFTDTAARLLPGKTSVHDLIMVLSVTSEKAISGHNRALLVKDITGAEEIAMRPELIRPE